MDYETAGQESQEHDEQGSSEKSPSLKNLGSLYLTFKVKPTRTATLVSSSKVDVVLSSIVVPEGFA